MLQARRSRPHSQHRQHRRKQHQVLQCSTRPGAGLLLSALLLLAALPSSVGSSSSGRPGVSHSSRPCFLGLRFGETATPPVPEPSSLGDRVRDFGERVRQGGGGVAGVFAGKGTDSADKEGEAMVAAQARAGSQEGPKDKSNGRNSFIAGGLAGSVSTTITCPIEVIFAVCCLGGDCGGSGAVGKK